jgi:molybdenum cofactor cytidylyltransferase
VLLLAAGRSERFGSDKRLAITGTGQTLLWEVIDRIRVAGLPLRVCLRGEDTELAAALAARDVSALCCARARDGMGATLAEGAAALPPWRGVLVALADMPWIKTDSYRELADSVGPGSICVPCFQGSRGNPVAFGRDFFPGLRRCEGDRGARSLLARHAGCVREVAVDDAGILADIDYRAQLSAIPD